jgi:uncharacterized Ntn-hydrolase superfamily protein
MPATRGTYSIVAADPEAGEVGVAVQSKYFCVGAVVPWAKAGIGAVATQAAGVAAYGIQALELLEAGAEPSEALRVVLEADEDRETRQLGAVTADGRAAAFTGAGCSDWAGHVVGDGFAVQGNILVGEAVVEGMAAAFRDTGGTLAERLMAALEAAQAAGGDKRGQQSAALVVERVDGGAQRREGIDRVVDLRVDDHERPVAELRRLLDIHTRWDYLMRSASFYGERDWVSAIRIAEDGLRRFPDDALLLYNAACFDALAGRADEALERLRRACDVDANIVEMARDDADFAAVRDDERFRAIVGV